MLKLLATPIMAAFLIGCDNSSPARPGTVEGNSIDALVGKFGPPDERFESRDGGNTYKWHLRHHDAGQSYKCEITAETDVGVIKKIKMYPESCDKDKRFKRY